jgi:hypothetical protein
VSFAHLIFQYDMNTRFDYFLESLIISFIVMEIIPTMTTQRIKASRAFVITKKLQTLKISSHGHSKKFISSYPYMI